MQSAHQILFVLAASLLGADGFLSQATDYLVHPKLYDGGSRLVTTKDTITLTNDIIERAFLFRGGAFCTIEYRHILADVTYFRAISPEANMTLNGTAFDVGGCAGQDPKHDEFFDPSRWLSNLTADPAALQYKNHTVGDPEPLFDWKPGTRSSPTDVAWPPKGTHLRVNFVTPTTARQHLRDVVVTVHYEIYDGLAALRKWVSVHHEGSATATSSEDGAAALPVVIDTLNYELLRAPNFAPERMSIVKQQANNPVPFDQQVVPVPGQSFPGRTEQLWFWDPHYDQGGDQEIHVTYTYYTLLLVGYADSVTYGGPTGPGWVVRPGESFESLSVREVLHDTTGTERVGLGVRQMHRVLAPALTEAPIPFMITDVSSSAAMRLAVDQASATGHELVIIGFGAAGWCGMCHNQISNASFRAWMSGEVQYARSRSPPVEVSGYTLMQHNGWGEVTPPEEQCLSRDGEKRGPTACFATRWHAAYRAALLAFVKETGMGGIETDGQFEGIACSDEGGDHDHNGLAGGWAYQMEATLEFNRNIKKLGAYQTGADGYCFSGAQKWNHADTDAFGHLPLWEQHLVGRMYIYDSTVNRLPTSGQIGVNDLAAATKATSPATGQENGCGRAGLGRVGCFDFILGSQYLMGSVPGFRARALYPPADPDAAQLAKTIKKWTGFYKTWRGPRPSGAAGLLTATLVHVHRPDSRSLEAVVHATSDSSAPERAIAAFVNPTAEDVVKRNCTLPLYYAGLAPGTAVRAVALDIGAPGGAGASAEEAAAGRLGTMYVVGSGGAGFTDIVVQVTVRKNSYAAILISTVSENEL